MRGWFDAFRNDGGPTLYNFNNRTAVTGDVTIITFLTIFCTLYVAFLIILPGIRKERFSTFFAVTLSLLVGATILISLYGSAWHVANASILSTYRAFSKEKIPAQVGVYVGLRHLNITLQTYSQLSNWTGDIDFNEQFVWINPDQMSASYYDAIKRGLPYPILTISEYFTMGQDGLFWGGQYRTAGYYAVIMLWTSFAIWLLMNLMLITVPRYGAVLMTTCGLLLICTCYGYYQLLPDIQLTIHIEGSVFKFTFGWCYWLVVIVGAICLLSGFIITTIEIIYPHSFSTILEIDYDTPYDRHIIIEDSRGRRYQKKQRTNSNCNKLEEPVSIGTRILRRLSSRNKDETYPTAIKTTPIQSMELGPKSNWKYNINDSYREIVPKSVSQESVISSISRQTPSVHRAVPKEKIDKIQEVSMW